MCSSIRLHGELEISWAVVLSFFHVFWVLDVLGAEVLFLGVRCVQFRTVFASMGVVVVLLRNCQNGNNYPTSRVGFSFRGLFSKFIADGLEKVVDSMMCLEPFNGSYMGVVKVVEPLESFAPRIAVYAS